jgi:two-component system sensor histidine kinase VicK
MASSLAENVAEIVREKNRNEIVLYNMTDGVLAYDAAGSLIHYNNACYELLNFTNINGMTFDEMMESLGIAIPESEFYSDDQSRDITIFINDRYLNATYNPYRDKSGAIEGVIIVLQDITRHKKLDNMRKEFVANVSHEIRTPLTTIKGYAEILLDGEIDNRENAVNFLNVINGETDRMMLLVNDLLELSRSDYDRMELNMKEIDLLALVEQNVEYHKITAAKQNKTITFNSSLRRANVCVDPDRINQVINNIITNSFKYSAENAAVNVSVEPSESYYRVYVRDNGMGIPKEDLARIFERFYRVDKARSRAMGGTGLGLSIAQEIMESHGGKITAVSEFGKGTTMILRFPKIGEIPLEE